MPSPANFFSEVPFRSITLVALLLLVVAVVARARAAGRHAERTRADVAKQIDETRRALAAAPDDDSLRFQLAKHLYESGDFPAAADVLAPLAQTSEVESQTALLAAQLAYLLGDYQAAARHYDSLVQDAVSSPADRALAIVGLGFTYYQTNDYHAFKSLEFPAGLVFPGAKLIRSFQDSPYQISWTGGEPPIAHIPFAVSEPLPLLTIECDGHPVDVLFDTGADTCILDSDLAEQWGIQEVDSVVGAFGGGKLGRVGFAKLSSVRLGNVTLRNLPVMTLPTRRFSPLYKDHGRTVDGIIGTGLIRQFLATVDYEHARLTLRPRSPEAAAALRDEFDHHLADEVPFALATTHLMLARGTLNDRSGLTFFVDSGLAMQAALSAPAQTLRHVGIPEPEKSKPTNSVGGGGGVWESGTFPIHTLALGNLQQQDLLGEFGSRTEATYWQLGFIQDGLISHRFLSRYASWTIDFDNMTFLFTHPRAD